MADEEKKAPAPREISILHKRSKQFSSHFASGAIVSGPTPDGMLHLIFFSDAVGIEKETGVLVAEDGDKATYEPRLGHGDIINFREDKVRLSMTTEGMRAVYEMLKNRFETSAEKTH